MDDRRWPWLLAATCLLGSGVAAAMATYRHWQPCEQSLLVGTAFERLSPRADFSDECLRRMDAGSLFPLPELADRTPGSAELGVTAMVLAALAWLVVVLAMRWSRTTKAVAVLPALVLLMLAGTAAVGIGAPRSASEPVALWLSIAVDITAVAAFAATWGREPAVRGVGLVRVLLMLWGVTSFGLLRLAADYMIMMSWSSATWDVPPGMGWPTVAGLVASAVVGLVLSLISGPGQTQALRGHPEPRRLQSGTEVR